MIYHTDILISGGWMAAACKQWCYLCSESTSVRWEHQGSCWILLSMQHLPNVFIYDKSYKVPSQLTDIASHGRNMPNSGRVCEATDENIHWAKERKLTLSMPWIEEPNDPPDEGNPHPVTGCNEVYCLTDTLHERNCKIPAEKLKSTRLVLELAGKLNTQVLEQINAEIGRSMYFLNEMSAYKQVFVLQLLMHLHNEKVNGKLLRTLTQKLGPLGKDSLGRLTCRYQ